MSKKAYLATVLNVLTRTEKLGLTVERDFANESTLPETPSGNFMFVRIDGGTAALIIPKHDSGVKWCDSHIDWSGKAGYVPLEKSNGTVMCRIDPKSVDWEAYLTALSGASQRDRKGPSKTASQATDALIAALKAVGLPKASPTVIVRKPDASELVTEEASEEDFSTDAS